MQKLMSMTQKVDSFKDQKTQEKHRKQQELFKAEQKRADMKNALYHMAVWNVQEAGDIIKEIINENDGNHHGVNGSASMSGGIGPKSVAEKVREKAALIRRNERLGLISRGSPDHLNGQEPMGFGHYENAGNGQAEFDRMQSN